METSRRWSNSDNYSAQRVTVAEHWDAEERSKGEVMIYVYVGKCVSIVSIWRCKRCFVSLSVEEQATCVLSTSALYLLLSRSTQMACKCVVNFQYHITNVHSSSFNTNWFDDCDELTANLILDDHCSHLLTVAFAVYPFHSHSPLSTTDIILWVTFEHEIRSHTNFLVHLRIFTYYWLPYVFYWIYIFLFFLETWSSKFV